MEELWNKLGAWGYAVPILMLLCLNILLFTDIFEKIIINLWKRRIKRDKCLRNACQ